MISSQFRHLIRRIPHEVQVRNIGLTCAKRSDDESDQKGVSAKHKLNELLLSIVKDQKDVVQTSEKNLETKFKKPKRPKPDDKHKELGQKIVVAAKEVIKSVEGDPDRNEAELLHKLLYKNEHLQKSVLKASGNSALSELLSGMTIEEETKKEKKPFGESKFSRADQVRSALGGRFPRVRDGPMKHSSRKINIFGEEPLNWFNPKEGNPNAPVLSTWNHCKAREMRLSVTHPPSNYWEQLIIWTDRGMLWKFPIDNEQGMDEEKTVSFEEHVFLENYLEGWCPDKGPIRHFMELVCVGLSRNHWLTAEEKKAHMLWYKDYFVDKKALIHELGAGEILQPNQKTT